MSVRTKFELKRKLVRWYPKHMSRGFNQIERTLRKVDGVLEVHDSRIPLSGRNTHFIRNLSSIKPHVLILNKMDLLDLRYKKAIKERLESEGNTRCLFVDASNPYSNANGFTEILPTVLDLIQSSKRYNREDSNDFNLMLIGIPNVGKSTIINKLRSMYLGVSGKATVTGALAGVTRSVLERIRINPNPPIYIYDTPGVLEPRVDNKDIESTMRCALCGTLSDQLIGYENIADYLLYWMNRRNLDSYVNFLKLDKPSDDITEVLIKGAVSLDFLYEGKCDATGDLIRRPNLEQAAQALVNAFRKGSLGRFLLDDHLLLNHSKFNKATTD